MRVVYSSEKTKDHCTSYKAAKKLFGGNDELAKKLLSRIQALTSAATLKDIVITRPFRFHKLSNKNGRDLEGYFAIDVKSPKEPWRIILQPLDEDKKPYQQCNIDLIANIVRIVEVTEVSKHYE